MTDEVLQLIREAKEQRATKLQIKGPWLPSLPPEIGELTELIALDIGPYIFETYIGIGQGETDIFEEHNHLSELPSEIGKLRNLKQLYVTKNSLRSLPAEIGELENLEILDLMDNHIAELPIEIIKLKNLKFLDLRKNRLKIPPEILEKTDEPDSILTAYFGLDIPLARAAEEALQSSPRQPLLETKVLILGQGSVGKTSLVQRILHSTFNQNQIKTEGISINQWLLDD